MEGGGRMNIGVSDEDADESRDGADMPPQLPKLGERWYFRRPALKTMTTSRSMSASFRMFEASGSQSHHGVSRTGSRRNIENSFHGVGGAGLLRAGGTGGLGAPTPSAGGILPSEWSPNREGPVQFEKMPKPPGWQKRQSVRRDWISFLAKGMGINTGEERRQKGLSLETLVVRRMLEHAEDSLFEDSFDDWETDDRNDDDSSDGERDGSSSTLGHAAENIPLPIMLPERRRTPMSWQNSRSYRSSSRSPRVPGSGSRSRSRSRGRNRSQSRRCGDTASPSPVQSASSVVSVGRRRRGSSTRSRTSHGTGGVLVGMLRRSQTTGDIDYSIHDRQSHQNWPSRGEDARYGERYEDQQSNNSGEDKCLFLDGWNGSRPGQDIRRGRSGASTSGASSGGDGGYSSSSGRSSSKKRRHKRASTGGGGGGSRSSSRDSSRSRGSAISDKWRDCLGPSDTTSLLEVGSDSEGSGTFSARTGTAASRSPHRESSVNLFTLSESLYIDSNHDDGKTMSPIAVGSKIHPSGAAPSPILEECDRPTTTTTSSGRGGGYKHSNSELTRAREHAAAAAVMVDRRFPPGSGNKDKINNSDSVSPRSGYPATVSLPQRRATTPRTGKKTKLLAAINSPKKTGSGSAARVVTSTESKRGRATDPRRQQRESFSFEPESSATDTDGNAAIALEAVARSVQLKAHVGAAGNEPGRVHPADESTTEREGKQRRRRRGRRRRQEKQQECQQQEEEQQQQQDVGQPSDSRRQQFAGAGAIDLLRARTKSTTDVKPSSAEKNKLLPARVLTPALGTACHGRRPSAEERRERLLKAAGSVAAAAVIDIAAGEQPRGDVDDPAAPQEHLASNRGKQAGALLRGSRGRTKSALGSSSGGQTSSWTNAALGVHRRKGSSHRRAVTPEADDVGEREGVDGKFSRATAETDMTGFIRTEGEDHAMDNGVATVTISGDQMEAVDVTPCSGSIDAVADFSSREAVPHDDERKRSNSQQRPLQMPRQLTPPIVPLSASAQRPLSSRRPISARVQSATAAFDGRVVSSGDSTPENDPNFHALFSGLQHRHEREVAVDGRGATYANGDGEAAASPSPLSVSSGSILYRQDGGGSTSEGEALLPKVGRSTSYASAGSTDSSPPRGESILNRLEAAGQTTSGRLDFRSELEKMTAAAIAGVEGPVLPVVMAAVVATAVTEEVKEEGADEAAGVRVDARPPAAGVVQSTGAAAAAAAAVDGGGYGKDWDKLEMHRAVYAGDKPGLRFFINARSQGVKQADHHGNTPLLLALKLGRTEMAWLLIRAGSDLDIPSDGSFHLLEEAIVHGDEHLLVEIYGRLQRQSWARWRAKVPNLLSLLDDSIPDFYMEMHWSFECSNVLAPIVKAVAPHDHYRIWKKGSWLRMDSTITGYTKRLKTQRGNVSLLFLGNDSPAPGTLIKLDHGKKKIYNVLRRLESPTPSEVRRTCRRYLAAGQSKRSTHQVDSYVIKAGDLDFKPVKDPSGKIKTGTVGSWSCERHECTGDMQLQTFRKGPGDNLLTGLSMKDYFDARLTLAEKVMKASSTPTKGDSEGGGGAVNSSSSPAAFFGFGDRSRENQKAKILAKINTPHKRYEKKIKASMWMSQDFPLTLEHVTPMLEVLSMQDKVILKLKEVLTTKGMREAGFPAKVSLPLYLGVFAAVAFDNCKVYKRGELDPELFRVNPEYGSSKRMRKGVYEGVMPGNAKEDGGSVSVSGGGSSGAPPRSPSITTPSAAGSRMTPGTSSSSSAAPNRTPPGIAPPFKVWQPSVASPSVLPPGSSTATYATVAVSSVAAAERTPSLAEKGRSNGGYSFAEETGIPTAEKAAVAVAAAPREPKASHARGGSKKSSAGAGAGFWESASFRTWMGEGSKESSKVVGSAKGKSQSRDDEQLRGFQENLEVEAKESFSDSDEFDGSSEEEDDLVLRR